MGTWGPWILKFILVMEPWKPRILKHIPVEGVGPWEPCILKCIGETGTPSAIFSKIGLGGHPFNSW